MFHSSVIRAANHKGSSSASVNRSLSQWFLACSSGMILLALAACAPMAQVRNVTPRLAGAPALATKSGRPEQLIREAGRLESRDPRAAMGLYLEAAQSALADLRKSPREAAALRDYNFAISRVFSVILKHHIDAWSQPLQAGGYLLTSGADPRSRWKPADFDFIPADQLAVGGLAFRKKAACDGLGAPVVAVNRAGVADYQELFLGSKNIYYGITVVARFEGKHCVVSFEDPLSTDTVKVAGHSFPLAADYSAAPAMLLAKERPDRMGLVRLLWPTKFQNTESITVLQAYDPAKIPVLFVHGLQDTPATWAPMINALRTDPVLRKRYQFWVYSYPSGYPYPYSAMMLRQKLDQIHKAFPHMKRIVVIGHSMGGMISRLMVTDSGMKLWSAYFSSPPDRIHVSAKDRKWLAGCLIFKVRPDISRVVFMCAPHRGSDFASNWIGRTASRIVWLPVNLVLLGKDVVKTVALGRTWVRKAQRMPNSIDTLSPGNLFVKTVNTLPVAHVPYHSIIGDRGRHDTPDSSDGVVAYWSSHLDGAESECIVPSGHMAIRDAEAIEEVDRILKLHLARQN